MWSRRARRAGLAALACAVVACAAHADTPRMDLGVGIWQHDAEGTLASDDPLLEIPPDFPLSTEKESYARFGVRIGSAWWAPVLRVRRAELTAQGSVFVDNSTPPLLVDTTDTRRELDFEQLEGLLYFTLGETIRGELGGGLRKADGEIHVVETRTTTLGGTVVTDRRRELPTEVSVIYGGLYAEPVSWLSFGGEAVGSAGGDVDLLDATARFVIKPFTWMGVEGGYRFLKLEAEDNNDAAYELEFRGLYAGLSFLYGSKNAGLFDPDADHDGVPDAKDRCKDSTPGAVVDARGCEPDRDGDGVPDGRDDCLATPRGAVVDASGCHKDTDGDAVPDGVDSCPNTPPGVAVNAQGCAVDADGDGVSDDADQCPGSPAGVEVDRSGCPHEPDADSDGVPDTADRCPDSVGPVDASGCPLEGAPAIVQAPPPDLTADEDRDGVPDARDRCRRTPRGFKVDATGCALRQATVLQGITFAKNSSYLMRDSEVLLLEVVEGLKAQRGMQVEIQGHTCDLGPGEYNKWLSQRRANRVMEFLVRHGIDRSRLTAVGYGEERPLVPNDDERMRELNRRTVFVVVEQ